MLPEGIPIQNNTTVTKNELEEFSRKKSNKLHNEGTENFELSSFRNPKSWKKSITSFFRNQLRSTKSNDGDNPSGSKSHFDGKEVNPEQKWQSLGKVFRRQSFVDQNQKSPTQREATSQNKRFAVRKVLSSYFGKAKAPDQSLSDSNENLK